MPTIRTARESDIPDLLAIYAPYVLNTAITFEYEVPSVEEFQRRVQKTLLKYPYLVLVEEGKILGYAYASTYKRGYEQVAHFPKIGYKFGKWHDIVWMQKSLTPPDDMKE